MNFKNYVKAIFIKSNTLMHEHGGAHEKNKNKKKQETNSEIISVDPTDCQPLNTHDVLQDLL